MNQKRLNPLVILSTYHKEVKRLDIDELVDEFVIKNETRI